jgi:hypothetical protein
VAARPRARRAGGGWRHGGVFLDNDDVLVVSVTRCNVTAVARWHALGHLRLATARPGPIQLRRAARALGWRRRVVAHALALLAHGREG